MRNNYLGYLFLKNVIRAKATMKNATSIFMSVVCTLLKCKKGNKYSVSLNFSLSPMCILFKYTVFQNYLKKKAINKA